VTTKKDDTKQKERQRGGRGEEGNWQLDDVERGGRGEVRSRGESGKEGEGREGKGGKGRVEWTSAVRKQEQNKAAASDPTLATHRISLLAVFSVSRGRETLTRLAGWTGRVCGYSLDEFQTWKEQIWCLTAADRGLQYPLFPLKPGVESQNWSGRSSLLNKMETKNK